MAAGRGKAPGRKFRLLIHPAARAEWDRLDNSVKAPFRKKLSRLLAGEAAPSPRDALAGLPPGYFKIKLRGADYRLVYFYAEDVLQILMIAVGRRDRKLVYEAARRRLGKN
jgi:mRNA interferase RelE/StbE